nr:hypothetical protein [Tanacetum cinerariifolium]
GNPSQHIRLILKNVTTPVDSYGSVLHELSCNLGMVGLYA